MKVEQIADKSIDSFGGLYFFHQFIEKTDFRTVVAQVLGERPALAVYSYTDVLSSFAASDARIVQIQVFNTAPLTPSHMRSNNWWIWIIWH